MSTTTISSPAPRGYYPKSLARKAQAKDGLCYTAIRLEEGPLSGEAPVLFHSPLAKGIFAKPHLFCRKDEAADLFAGQPYFFFVQLRPKLRLYFFSTLDFHANKHDSTIGQRHDGARVSSCYTDWST